jgi:hypothetical protein
MIRYGDDMMSITHIGFAVDSAGGTFLAILVRFGDDRLFDRKLTLTMILSPDAYTSLSAISDET